MVGSTTNCLLDHIQQLALFFFFFFNYFKLKVLSLYNLLLQPARKKTRIRNMAILMLCLSFLATSMCLESGSI